MASSSSSSFSSSRSLSLAYSFQNVFTESDYWPKKIKAKETFSAFYRFYFQPLLPFIFIFPSLLQTNLLSAKTNISLLLLYFYSKFKKETLLPYRYPPSPSPTLFIVIIHSQCTVNLVIAYSH